jgi:hypothetical protein
MRGELFEIVRNARAVAGDCVARAVAIASRPLGGGKVRPIFYVI